MTTRTLKVRLVAQDKASGKIRKVSSTLKTLGAIAGVVGAVELGRRFVAGVTRTVSSIITLGAQFQQTMSVVKALIQPTAREFKKLENAAKDLGRTTVFSASQAAEAMSNFALAGFSVKEIMGAIGPTLNLAAAGTLDMATAATTTAGIMRAMNLDTDRLNAVVDTLAKTATSSAQDVIDLANAFRKAATPAAELGISAEELAAIFAVLANRMILAEEAGTGLRKIFAVMQGELEEGQAGLAGFGLELFDVDGKFVGMTEAIRRMTAAGVNSRNALGVFGLRAGAIGQILLRSADAIDVFTEANIRAGGVAEQVGRDKLDNLRGKVQLLTSAWETLAIELFKKVEPALSGLVVALTEIVNITGVAARNADGLKIASRALSVAMLRSAAGVADFVSQLQRLEALDFIKKRFKSEIAPFKEFTKQFKRLGSGILATTDHIFAFIAAEIQLQRVVKSGETVTGEDFFKAFDLNLQAFKDLRIVGLEAGKSIADSIGDGLRLRADALEQSFLDLDFEQDVSDAMDRLRDAVAIGFPVTAHDAFGIAIKDAIKSGSEGIAIEVPVVPVLDKNLFADIGGLLPDFGAALEFNIETGKFVAVNTELQRTIEFVEKIGEASIKRNSIEADVTRNVALQVTLGEDLLAAWENINRDFGDSPELLAAMRDQILLAADGVREGLNPELDLLLERLLLAKEAMEGIETEILPIQDGIRLWTQDAEAFREEVAKGGIAIEGIGKSISRTFKEQGVNAAVAMGDAMVSAALGAKIAWGDFLKNLIRDMIAAIIRMLILTAIAKAIGAAFGGPAGAAAGAAVGTLAAQEINSATLENPSGVDIGGLVPSAPTVVINAEGAVFLDEGMPARLARQIGDGLAAAQQRGVLVGP